jgi:hypothetical protein
MQGSSAVTQEGSLVPDWPLAHVSAAFANNRDDADWTENKLRRSKAAYGCFSALQLQSFFTLTRASVFYL